MRIIILFTGNFDVEGRVKHCKEGEILDVSEQDAERMIEALQAEEYKEVKNGRKNK